MWNCGIPFAGKPSSPAGRAQDTSSILQGESDPLRARERINSTTARSSYYAVNNNSIWGGGCGGGVTFTHYYST